MNFDNLKKMSPEQLREIAGKQGLKVHHKAKPETVIKQIMEAALTPQQAPVMHHVAEESIAPVDHNTPEEVEAAIAHIKARQPAFESKYDLRENTWHFACNGALECGNLDIPLRVIVTKANTISRGRLAPRGLTHEFDSINAGGKNAYTNTVLTF
jgi:hypothetical protein